MEIKQTVQRSPTDPSPACRPQPHSSAHQYPARIAVRSVLEHHALGSPSHHHQVRNPSWAMAVFQTFRLCEPRHDPHRLNSASQHRKEATPHLKTRDRPAVDNPCNSPGEARVVATTIRAHIRGMAVLDYSMGGAVGQRQHPLHHIQRCRLATDYDTQAELRTRLLPSARYIPTEGLTMEGV